MERIFLCFNNYLNVIPQAWNLCILAYRHIAICSTNDRSFDKTVIRSFRFKYPNLIRQFGTSVYYHIVILRYAAKTIEASIKLRSALFDSNIQKLDPQVSELCIISTYRNMTISIYQQKQEIFTSEIHLPDTNQTTFLLIVRITIMTPAT